MGIKPFPSVLICSVGKCLMGLRTGDKTKIGYVDSMASVYYNESTKEIN